MNDRLPGSCWDNPIWYRNYRIYLSSLYECHGLEYQYVHDDYDGTEDSRDKRSGLAESIEDAKRQIDYQCE